MWDDKLWENSWLVVAERGLQAVSFQQSPQNKPVGRRETVSKTFLVYHVELFSVPTLCGSFWKSWRESPNNWQRLVVPWTKSLLFHLNRWKLHIIWFSIWSEILCCFETDVLGLETSLSRVVVKKLTVRKKLKKSTTRRKKWKKNVIEGGSRGSRSSLTLVNNILHSISSNVEVYINNQEIYNSNRMYA